MEKLPISVCILSWKSGNTLKNTLKSYKKFGLLEMIEDIVVLFQEVSDEDKKTADQYKVKYIGLQENIGIGKGMKTLAENAACDNILFLEHDFELIENEKTVFSRLKSGLELLNNGFDVIRYRSREQPGYPLISIRHKGNELNYYDDWHECTSPHLLESLHWLDPAAEFPDKIQKQENILLPLPAGRTGPIILILLKKFSAGNNYSVFGRNSLSGKKYRGMVGEAKL